MPFKTRRQKQSAAARRFTFDNTGAVSYGGSFEVKVVKSKHAENVSKKANNDSEVFDVSYIRKDLLKIVIFAFFIIGAQLLLRFYFKF